MSRRLRRSLEAFWHMLKGRKTSAATRDVPMACSSTLRRDERGVSSSALQPSWQMIGQLAVSVCVCACVRVCVSA